MIYSHKCYKIDNIIIITEFATDGMLGTVQM